MGYTIESDSEPRTILLLADGPSAILPPINRSITAFLPIQCAGSVPPATPALSPQACTRFSTGLCCVKAEGEFEGLR
jgi:hypothetical protein